MNGPPKTQKGKTAFDTSVVELRKTSTWIWCTILDENGR